MYLLSKTDFILCRECPNNVWVKIHKPEEYAKFEVSEFEKSLAKMGNEVEELARGMFSDGYLIEKRSAGAQELTYKLINEKTPVIFQAVFSTDKYIAATDVLKWNKSANKYDIYEIKMSSAEGEDNEDDGTPKKVNTKREMQYECDLAFQVNVVESCGIALNKKYLVRLNRAYIRQGDLDFTEGKLFLVEDRTEKIDNLKPEALTEMSHWQNYLSTQDMPKSPCPCYYKGRNSQCTSFSYLNPTVPKYSVHDLNRVGSSPKLLKTLLDANILEVFKIPADFDGLVSKPTKANPHPKPRKLNQIKVSKSQEPLIDLESIRHELEALKFPLYFLDYETYPTAIPQYNHYHPYQHVVFQYSLHVLKDVNSEPFSFEKIVLDGEPSERISESLRENIGDTGTIISWFKTFENCRNKELANLVPKYKDFFLGMVSRTYDLMDIVEKQYYIHPEFEGRSSIKKVLPAVAKILGKEEELSYKKLGVQNGTDAIEAYRKIIKGELVGELAKAKEVEMLKYCKLDTHAMYILWKFFYDLCYVSSVSLDSQALM